MSLTEQLCHLSRRHGGPGGGCSGCDRRYFDPNVYRIILVDQRGSGKSLPAAELKVLVSTDKVNLWGTSKHFRNSNLLLRLY